MLVEVSLVFIMINKLNTDQALIEIKRLENTLIMHNDNKRTVRQIDGWAVIHWWTNVRKIFVLVVEGSWLCLCICLTNFCNFIVSLKFFI